jgi:hypothetical protein
MKHIPSELKQYLSSEDRLYRARVLEQYPGLQQILENPGTRELIVSWLSSDEAHDKPSAELAASSLKFLRPNARQDDAPVIRTFLLHADGYVRLRAYEFLLTLYFPDKNREAMLLLLHNMLSDSDDMVRSQGARYIERAGAASELAESLRRWQKNAVSQGWQGTESFELVEGLLKGT